MHVSEVDDFVPAEEGLASLEDRGSASSHRVSVLPNPKETALHCDNWHVAVQRH